LSLRYPIDAGDRNTFMPTVTFTPYTFDMAEATVVRAEYKKKAPGDPVVLYMPAQVSENYGGQWGLENAINMSSWNEALGSLNSTLQDAFKKGGGSLTSGLAAKMSMTPAPTDMLIYQKPVQPFLNFNYEFVPRNAAEGAAVVSIIKFFKDMSLPTYKMAGDNMPWGLVDWPSVWSIVFKSVKGPGNPRSGADSRYDDMALESVNVTYSGGANSVLVFTDEVPVKVSIQLGFKSIMYAIRGR
jgi:hypothetical protein